MVKTENVDGSFNMVPTARLDIPAKIQKVFGIYRGFSSSYKEAKEKHLTIPKEKRRVPYVRASNVIVLFPSDAKEDEILKNLEKLVEILRIRWEEELNK